MADPDPSTLRHTPLEDLQALLIGTLLVSLAVTLFQHAGLLSGGTAGIAFLAHYLGGWSFGLAYFVINLPFYWLAWRHMGKSFTLRTLAAVVLVAVMSDWLPRHLVLASLDAWLAALLGGVLMGNGFLVLFRHQASLGGLGILALLAQKKKGWRAGHVQMAMDAAIVCAALATVPLDRVALSVAAAVVLNLVIATNHRPGRYVAQ
ncbi:YitT family protein [Rhizobacter sp. J219]|uniref:YitT family protein n=1 Tax=Burkholderiales TaxID=80840 RepID=UPI00191CE837|nr:MULTISPECIES: YitT family protein [Burkholderiales]MBL0728565.1 YitT family protein [Piscinibacter sp. HJYY11]MCR5885074.1 YitT family protein [Rhizobacter sp. J219]